MLKENQFTEWCNQNGISTETKSLINTIRTSEPARSVGNGPGYNVTGRFPSQKMKKTIQYDSHRVELAQVYELEYDDDVLEYYDQPIQILLRYTSINGRPTTAKSTPDFFVIRKNSATFIECKTEKQLNTLEAESPNRWQNDKGKWRCPPGENYSAQFGLGFKIYSSKEINWVWQRNIQFLEDYIRSGNYEVNNESKENILNLTKNSPGMTILNMINNHGVLADDIYKLILSGEIYIDLYSQVIPEPQSASLFINREIAQAFSAMTTNTNPNEYLSPLQTFNVMSEIIWNGELWTIISIEDGKIHLLNNNSKTVALTFDLFNRLITSKEIQLSRTDFYDNPWMLNKINHASKSDLKEALKRSEYVRLYLNGTKANNLPVPDRTLRDWKHKYLEAEKLCGQGFVGLIPKNSAKGNRNTKLTDEMSELIETIIESEYETITNKGITAVYGKIRNEFIKRGWIPVSRKTVSARVKLRSGYEQTKKISGRKAAYQVKDFFWLGLTVPVHGDAPFQVAHLDHTELEIELRHSRNFKNLGRPNVTTLMDAFNRRYLAIYVSFEKPSYRSNMMVLRECVRRHHRLPRTIIVDRGKDFQSEYFDTLLGVFDVNKKIRPTSAPRFGSVGERPFETMNTQCIHNLKGNTKLTRMNPRQMTKDVNPKNHVTWDIKNFYEALCKWAYEVYDTQVHSSLGQSPEDQYKQGIREGGLREFTFIPYDQAFKFLTMPTTPKGVATIDCQRGIKVNYFNYWHPEFSNRDLSKKKVDVRYDPFNMGSIFAYVNGTWVECYSPHGDALYGRTEQEIEQAVKELRQLKRQNGQAYNITAENLAKYLLETEATELLLEDEFKAFEEKRLRAEENSAIVEKINGSKPKVKPDYPQVSPNINLDELLSLEVR